MLLGAATWAGVFEATYNLAPPRVLENSVNTLTALVLCLAVGFAASALAAPQRERAASEPTSTTDDEVLEDSK